MSSPVSKTFVRAFKQIVADIDPKSGRAPAKDLARLADAEAAMKRARRGVEVREANRPTLMELAAAQTISGALKGDGEIDARDVPALVQALDAFSPGVPSVTQSELNAVAAPENNVRVREYDLALDLSLGWAEASYPAKATVKLERAAKGDEPIVLDFNAERLELDAAGVKAKTPAGVISVPAEVKNGRLLIDAPGATQLFVSYRVKAVSTDEGEYGLLRNLSDANNPRMATILWPYQAGSLFPSVSSPEDGASFKLDVKGPPGSTVITNSTDQSVPAYDVAMYAAQNFEEHQGGTSKGGVKVTFFTAPGAVPAAQMKKNLDMAVKSLDFYSGLLGAYPFGNELKGIQAVTDGFSMEHPGAIAFNESVLKDPTDGPTVVAHEIAHHWFGNDVRVKDWNFVMSEGFATYLESRAVEEVLGKKPGLDHWKENKQWGQRSLRNAPHAFVPPDETDVNTVFNGVPYALGAWMLRTVEQELGRPQMDAVLKSFYGKYQNRAADMMDFVRHVKAETGKDVLPLVDQFNTLTEVPHVNAHAKAKGNVLTIDTANLTNVPAGWKVPVVVYGAPGQTKTFEVELKDRNHVELDAGFPIKRYEFDPDAKVMVDVSKLR